MRILSIAVFCVLAFTACSSVGGSDSEESASVFATCEDGGEFAELAGSECAYVEAPLDYEAIENGFVRLFVRRFPASGESKGQVWLLAGGPGESGASFYADIAFFRKAFKGYDLMTPDHRGTGYSTKLCEPEETAGSAAGLALEGEEWGSCFGALFGAPNRAAQFTRRNAARDIDFLISKLGADKRKKTYVYAVSYGTSLALEYAKLASEPVDGVILDSLMPADTDEMNDLSHRSHQADRAGRALLDRCSEDPSCPLGADANAQYDRLLAKLDEGELPDGAAGIPNGDLRQYLGLLLDVPAARNRIPAIINALAEDDPRAGEIIAETTRVYEDYWRRILRFQQAEFSIPLSGLIAGSEFNARPNLTAEMVAAEKSQLGFASPLPAILARGGLPLYEAPAALEASAPFPPVLVMQGTLDPKTPYDAALRRADALRSVAPVSVVTLLDAPHAGFLSAKDCIADPVAAFLAAPQAASVRECRPKGAELNFQ